METLTANISVKESIKDRIFNEEFYPHAESLYNFAYSLAHNEADAADLVLPSKLTNMLASGRPAVVTAAQGSGLEQEVNGCGIVTEPGDATEFADAIVKLIDDKELHQALSLASRKRAEERWSLRMIIDRLEQKFKEITQNSN